MEASKKVLETLKNSFGIIPLYHAYKYLMMSNFFAKNGFKITQSNREDVMLDIITNSEGDVDLIPNLEKYLTLQNSYIETDKNWYEKYNNFIDRLDNEKDIDEQVSAFLSNFN